MSDQLILFFDGCHKIYYCESDDLATISTMQEYGYDPIRGNFSKELQELWDSSCSLRFVDHASFDPTAPTVPQTARGGLTGFRTKVKKWVNERKKVTA